MTEHALGCVVHERERKRRGVSLPDDRERPEHLECTCEDDLTSIGSVPSPKMCAMGSSGANAIEPSMPTDRCRCCGRVQLATLGAQPGATVRPHPRSSHGTYAFVMKAIGRKERLEIWESK